MNTIFKDLITTNKIVIYMDDILILSSTLDELDKLMHSVLQHLEEYNLYLKPKKCTFGKQEIEYLGLVIAEGKIAMNPAKLQGIIQWPMPKKLHNVQAFLGFCNFYRWFIKNYLHTT